MRNALVLFFLTQLTVTAALAQDAGNVTPISGIDGGSLEAGAPLDASARDGGGDGGKISHPFQDPDNDELIDEYTSDHGSHCSASGPHSVGSGLSSMVFALSLILRARRSRR